MGRIVLFVAAAVVVAGPAVARSRLLPDPYPEVLDPQPMPTLPEGLSLTVRVPSETPRLATPLEREIDAARALAACWAPPERFLGARWGAVSVRLAMRRDGSIIGAPRITSYPAVDDGAKTAVARSLITAFSTCKPALSPSLGAAIAGQPFTIRFIQTDQKDQP